MGSSYEIELNMNELKYMLFGKKKCPKCGNKMKNIKKSKLMTEGIYSMNLG